MVFLKDKFKGEFILSTHKAVIFVEKVVEEKMEIAYTSGFLLSRQRGILSYERNGILIVSYKNRTTFLMLIEGIEAVFDAEPRNSC